MAQCGCNREPSLRDLLEAQIVQLVMTRDGVASSDVAALMDKVAASRARHKPKHEIDVCSCRPKHEIDICLCASSVDPARRPAPP